jgi:hypothetical protein
MQGNGIKAAQIQAQYSELNSTWAAGPLPAANAVPVVKRVAAWLSGLRRTGRHAAPGRSFLTRRGSR